MGTIEDLKAAVEPLLEDALGVLLWGSHATGDAHARSDVDLCIVAGPDADASLALQAAWTKARLLDPRYDLKVFEDLPLYLKGEVLDRGLLLASRDAPALWEYLRGFRKVWEDQSVRRHGPDELARLVEARRARNRA